MNVSFINEKKFQFQNKMHGLKDKIDEFKDEFKEKLIQRYFNLTSDRTRAQPSIEKC